MFCRDGLFVFDDLKRLFSSVLNQEFDKSKINKINYWYIVFRLSYVCFNFKSLSRILDWEKLTLFLFIKTVLYAFYHTSFNMGFFLFIRIKKIIFSL